MASRHLNRLRWPRIRRLTRRRWTPVAETEMAIMQDLIEGVRNLRAELKIEPKQKVAIEIFADGDIRSLIERNRGAVERLANVEGITFVDVAAGRIRGCVAHGARARAVPPASMCACSMSARSMRLLNANAYRKYSRRSSGNFRMRRSNS